MVKLSTWFNLAVFMALPGCSFKLKTNDEFRDSKEHI